MTQGLNVSQVIPANISGSVSGFFASSLTSPTAQTVFVLVAIVAGLVLIFIFRKFIVNSILGIVGLVILNAIGVKIGISIVNVLLCGALGLFGLAILIVLHLLGFAV